MADDPTTQEINPLTGLPYVTGGPNGQQQVKVNPLTGRPFQTQRIATSPFKGTVGMAGSFEDYNGTWLSPATDVNPFADIDEQRARNQSTWDKWGNGLAKAGLTFTGAVSENTLGYTLGLVDYMASGFEDFEESMANNPVGTFFDGLNDRARAALPNYQTREEQRDQGTLSQIGNANFWADTVMNGAAYSLGSVASAYLMGGVGTVSAIGRGLGASTRISKSLASYRAAKALQNGLGVGEALKKGRAIKTGISRGSKAIGFLEGGAMMSIAESAVEAREIEDNIRGELIRDYKLKNGLGELDRVPSQEMRDIDLAAQEMGSLGFDANMAVLMPTNLLTFGGMLRPMAMGKNAIWGAGLTKEGGKKVLKESIENLPGWAQKGARLGRTYAKPTVTGAVSEGFQEGSQYAISEGLADFTRDEVEELGSVDAFNAMTNGRNSKAIGRVLKDGVKNVSTPEGREQAMVGALVGLLSGGIGGIRANRAKDERTKKALEYFNQFDNSVNLKTLAQSDEIAKRHFRAMEIAEQSNDSKAYDDAKFRLIRQMALTHAQNGTFDAFIERLEDTKELSEEEFNSLFGVETKVKSRGEGGRFQSVDVSNKERIDELVTRAKDLKATYEMVEELYPSVSPKGGLLKTFIRAAQGKERLAELRQQDADQNLYKHAMVLAMTESKDAEERALKNLKELQKLDPDLVIEEITDIESEGYDVALDKEGKEKVGVSRPEFLEKSLQESVDRAVENGASREQATKYAQSALNLLTDRNNAREAYNNLEASPEAREIYKQRKKLEAELKEQRRIDQAADNAINDSESHADLVKAAEQLDPDVSDEAKKRVQDEIVSRLRKVNEFKRKFEAMDPAQVKALNPADMEALEKEAWELDVEEIDKTKRTKPKRKAASENSKTKTKEAANKRGTEEAPKNKQGKGVKKDVRSNRGRAKKAVDQTNTLDTTTDIPGEQYSGQYNLVKGPDGRTYVQVDSKGNPVEGDRQAGHRLNGEPIITGRSRLADPEVNSGTEVTLVAIENDWWNNEATEAEKNDPNTKLPIYVKVGDDIIGVLRGTHTALREAVVEEWKKGNNEAVVTTIEEKLANRYFTAGSSQMGVFSEPFFYNPTESLGPDVVIGVVTQGENGVLRYTVPDGSPEVDQIRKDFQDRSPDKMVPGQVFYAIKDPHGKYRAAVASTSNLSKSDQVHALELMKEGNLDGLKELVGTNLLYALDGKVLTAKQAGEDVLYTFNAVDENGNPDPNLPEGMFIQVNQDLVNKALAGEVINLEDLTDVQASKLLIELNLGKTSEKGLEVQNETGIAPENPETAEYVAKNLAKLLQNIIQAKKYQVSMDGLNTEGGYVDSRGTNYLARNGVSGYVRYLTEGTQNPEGQGSKGILRSTTKSTNGSVFIDIGATLSSEFKVNGEEVTAADTTTAAPSNPERQAPGTPSAPRPSSEQNPADLLGGDTGPALTPPSGPSINPEPGPGDTVIEEASIDPETGQLIIPSAQPTSTVGDTQLDVIKKAQEAGISLDRLENVVLKIITNNPSIDIDLAHRTALFEIQQDIANKTRGPLRYTPTTPIYSKLNKSQAEKWLKDRGIPVSFYDQAVRIGNGTVHGYMVDAGVKLWTQGEVGTEYHESFHYIFRTLLNDKQRKALYAEAKKKFDITKEELAQLKKLNPKISKQELMELALEERMSEEFRDYVMTMEETAKTLPGKIRKFFKDLYNFIKAVFVNPVEMKQLYSLIESNRIPKRYLRNTEKFAGKATAYAYNEDVVDVGFHNELQNTLTTQFLVSYLNLTDGGTRDLTAEETRKLIGDKNNRGQVAEFFLKNSFRNRSDKKRLSIEDLAKVRNRINAGQPVGELFVELGMEQGIPMDTGLPQSLINDPNMHGHTAQWFRIVYQGWSDIRSKDNLENTLKFGWQSIMLQGLEKYGLSIKGNQKGIENDARDEANDEQDQFDKIYALGALEYNPMDRASKEVRRLLANIKSDKPNSLGMTTYVNIDDLVRLIVPATANKSSLNSMIDALKVKSKNFPQLNPVIEALNNDFSKQQLGAFFTVFSNNYTTLKLIEESYEDNKKLTRFINSNRKSASNNALDGWTQGGIEKQVPKPNAIFKDVNGKLQVNEEFDGQDRGALVAQAYGQMQDRGNSTEDRVRGLARVLHYMGLNLGETVEESVTRLGNYLQAQSELDEVNDVLSTLNNLIEEKIRPSYIVGAAFELNIDKSTKALIPGPVKAKKNPVNFFVQQSKRIKEIADIKSNFESPLAMSIVDGAGKVKYPYNLPTPLDAVLKEMQGLEPTDPRSLDLVKMMASDEFFNALGVARYQSLLKRLIDSGSFEIESFTMDVLKQEDEETSNIDYKNASARDSLIMRLEAYANNGNDFAYYALPTQETRGRMDFIKLPRFTSKKEMVKAGLGDVSGAEAIIRGLIIQDLIRINNDENIINSDESGGESLIQDYHTGRQRYKDFQLSGMSNTVVAGTGLNLSTLAPVVLEMEGRATSSKESVLFYNAVDKMVRNYLDTHISREVKELKAKIDDYNLDQEGASRLPLQAINRLGGKDKFLQTFVINDITARLEMAKLFRGGISMSKNVTDFYKRMGLINTPGSVFMLKGDVESAPDYGMFEEYNEGVIDEVRILDEVHNEIAEDYYDTLVEQGVPAAEAREITDKYRTEMADATDAQAFIIPSFWRALREGEGQFSVEDEQWYDNFEKGGKWAAKYSAPEKLYAESQQLIEFNTSEGVVKKYVADMAKNSYVLLTPEFVKGKPVLQQLYNKMIEDSIHVVNTVSAKKGEKRNVMRFDPTVETNIFNKLQTTKRKGSRLFKPQTINDKATDLVRLNRQIRKNMLNNVFRDQDYILNRGLSNEETVNGQDMLDEYHNSFQEIMNIQMADLKNELGFAKLQEANASNDAKAIDAARTNIFKKLRNLFLEENLKRDRLTDNMEKQLQLVYDNGVVDFAVPLAFPAYQDQYQGLFFSVFKNRVLKTMMNGKEVVQVASVGGMIENENGEARELRYLSVETDKSGKRIVHAEVMVNPSIAKKFGLKPGDDLSQVPEELLRAVGYRIPHQDKSSTLIMKVVGLLPKSYNKSIVVPGNITVMMGSDFDVDKMFVMFPEFAKASPLTNDYAKVTLDNYESLRGEPGQNLRKAALQNRMLDIMEAISSSPLHFKESITPLDPSTLRSIIAEVNDIVALDAERRPFDSPLKEIEMEENYKFSQKLVGIYANQLAGMAVASAGNNGTGVQVPFSKQFTVNGEILSKIQGRPETFKILVEHLSAALDAAKEIMQPQLNDNVNTVGSKAYLYGIGMDPKLVTMLHRTPMVMDFVKLVNIDGLSPNKAFERLGILSGIQRLIKTNPEGTPKIALSTPMTEASLRAGMGAQPKENGAYSGKDLALLKNFVISYYAGKDLQDFFSAITPDVLDGISDLGKLQELTETIEKFDKDDNMFGSASVQQFLTGDQYGLSKTFFETFREMLTLSSDIFLGATPGVKNFKEQFKLLTGKESFSADEHRAMDRALFYWMITQPGSPLNSMVAQQEGKEDPSLFMTSSTTNIVTELDKMRQAHPEEVGKNPFVMKLVASTTNESPNNRVFNIQFESLDKMTSDLTNDLTRGFNELLKSSTPAVRNFGLRLIRHQLMSTGFTPGYGSYYNMIPVDFFTQTMEGQTQSAAEFARAAIREAQQDPGYFNAATLEIARAMGTRRTQNKQMIPINNAQAQTVTDPEGRPLDGVIEFKTKADMPAIIARRYAQKNVDKIELFVKEQGNRYRRLNQSGINGQFNEINTGKNSYVSLGPKSTQKRKGTKNVGNLSGFVAAYKLAVETAGKARALDIISEDQNEQRVIERTCK